MPRRLIPITDPVSASNAYTLTASSGSFTLTGIAATLTPTHRYTLTAAAGSFSLTGNDATLTASHKYTLTAATGAFTLTGNSVTFTKTGSISYTLTADSGAFSLTGVAANLYPSFKYTLTAAKGGFTLTGNDAAFVKGYVVQAVSGAFTLTGTPVTFSTTGTVIQKRDQGAGRPSKDKARKGKRRLIQIGDRTYDVLERDIPALLEAELLSKRPPSTAEVVEGPKPAPKRKPKVDAEDASETLENALEAPSLDEVEQRYMALQTQLAAQAQADLQRMFAQVAQRVIADMEDEEETLIALLLT